LQLALRERPGEQARPAVVLASDKPTAIVLHANTAARRLHILPGMRYAAARALSAELRAIVLDPVAVGAAHDDLARGLSLFSPGVEPARAPDGAARLDTGRFYLDPSGLERLYGDARTWASCVHAHLRGRGLRAAVSVGFHRFRTEAVATGALVADARADTRRSVRVLDSPEEERDVALAIPLARLDIPAALRDDLLRLGVRTLGDLLALPADALGARFGAEARALHAAASTGTPLPVQGLVWSPPVRVTVELDAPDDDATRLLFAVRGALAGLLRALEPRAEAVARLTLALHLERGGVEALTLEPARPTRDAALLVDLLRLRLGERALASPVTAVDVEVQGARHEVTQLSLFPAEARRDLAAATRALARVRAAFGPASVTRARLRSAHLPEASFSWEPVTEVRAPRPRAPGDAPPPAPRLARVLLPRPRPIADPPRLPDDPWPTPDGRAGPVLRLAGPYRLSGGWWAQPDMTPVERDYYWAETRRGDLLWLFYDRARRRWFLQGHAD
jgi:protein ImuB